MDITIDQHVLGPVNWPGPGELRHAADEQYLDSDGRTVLAGNGTANYEVAVITVAAGVGTVAAITISSTKDSPDNSLATRSARIYDVNGVFRGFLYAGWIIPITLGTTVTIEQLAIYNATNAPYRTDLGYTRDEVNALLVAIVHANASNIIKGLVKLSDAPVDPTQPIAEGQNSARLTLLSTATDAPTANSLVKRDASGNFGGGLTNAGSTLIGADTDSSGAGDVQLQTGTVDRLVVKATSGNVGVGTNAPASDALLDLLPGDTRGFRLRRRSLSGPPSTGTWSADTRVIDFAGIEWICVTGGTPGVWRRSSPDLLSAIILLESTNLIRFPDFADVRAWGTIRTASGSADFRALFLASPLLGAYGHQAAVLTKGLTSDTAGITHNRLFPIDQTKRHRFGCLASSGDGAVVLTLNVVPMTRGLEINGGVLSQNVTPVSHTLRTLNNADVGAWFEATGGSAPAIPTGSSGAMVYMEHGSASVQAMFIFEVYFIQEDKLPTTTFTATSPGYGTHEATANGTDLYVISHAFATVNRYNTAMVRQAIGTTGVYPHDVMVFSGALWVVNYTGASLQKFNLTTLALIATYPLLGARKGLGIGNDGTFIYIGCGEGGDDAILKFDPATSVDGTTTGQSVLSTDVISSGTNLAVILLAGSIWSTSHTVGTVKRINPSTGALVATISPALGWIYGLGTDGTYMYANCTFGIAKIDPATNTVVDSKRYKLSTGGSSNLKYDGRGRMWGGAGYEVFYYDIPTSQLVEDISPSAGIKWVQPVVGGGVYAGYFHLPTLNCYGPEP